MCFSETERLICSSKESDIPHRQFSLGLKKEKKKKQQLWGSKYFGKSKLTRQAKLPDIKLCTTAPNKDREQCLPAPLTRAPEPAEMSRTGDAPLRYSFCSLKNYTILAEFFHFSHAGDLLFPYYLFFELDFRYSLARILALKTKSIA